MNYFVFDFRTDHHFIGSFLEAAALAHNHYEAKTKEWFFWKFRDNPFGESILACAEEDGEIVGCVAYGVQPFWLNNKMIKGAIAFENFVHPAYQGKGIFTKLITLAEEEASKMAIEILFVFPNVKSLPGYNRMKWSKLGTPEYWIKGRNLFAILFGFKNLKEGFIPSESNFSILNSPHYFHQSPKEQLTSYINLDYLKWRFFTRPVSEYKVIDNEEIYAIIRMGRRGNIKEGQVLFVNKKNEKSFKISEFVKLCKAKIDYDILSFPISKNNPTREKLKSNIFIKVPNRTNICYKILNSEIIKEKDLERIVLNAINYHTY